MGEWGVGHPRQTLLDYFGGMIYDAFGHYPYLVGSALKTTQWRDVDLRLILDDDEWDTMFGVGTKDSMENRKWAIPCAAMSLLGQQITGLPIDFQIQRRTEANAEHEGGRGATGLFATRSLYTKGESK